MRFPSGPSKKRWVFGLTGLFAILFVFYQQCSRAILIRPQPIVALKELGQVCTRTPANLELLQKTIFIVDESGSMAGLDPARTIAGLRNLVSSRQNDDNFMISIGMIYGGTAGFLPDLTGNPVPALQGQCVFYKPRTQFADLTQAINQVATLAQNPTGNGNFASFFNNVTQCIKTDILSIKSVIYNVVLVTDGAPVDITPQTAYDLDRKMISLGKADATATGVASQVNLFVYYMDDPSNNQDEATFASTLVSVSQQAGGFRSTYSVDRGGPIDFSAALGFLTFRHVITNAYVINMNAAPSLLTGELQVDTDGDGISDADEIRLGYDPNNRTSKGVCSDLIYYKLGNCPSSCASGQQYVDSDHDGASDCDELNMGTSPILFDSDGDGIPDGLELRIGSNPLDPTDALLDYDNDGANTLQEAKRQTSVYFNDSARTNLPVVTLNSVGQQNGESCYTLTVDNLPLFKTPAISPQNTMTDLVHGENQNVIKVLLFQQPIDIPNPPISLIHGIQIIDANPLNGLSNGFTSFDDTNFDLYVP
jgi:hypothetical protein